MIAITRSYARRLRGLLRRSTLGIAHRGTVPPLLLRTTSTEVRAEYRYDGLAVAHVESGPHGLRESITLPLDALADVEGRDDSPVALEADSPDKTVVHWEDRGVPQCRTYVVPPLRSISPFPDLPASWVELPAGLLDALAEAAATGTGDSARYALGCILLRASADEVVATDGHQLLVQGGFAFPWEGDVLVKRSPAFASKALPRDRLVFVGRTDTHVVLRAGPWTLALEVQADARFPRVDQVIPEAHGMATRLRLDASDVAFLGLALGRLPGADMPNGPATLDLNGRIAVRARGADPSRATELVLAHSGYTGAPVRVNVNRAFLARALRLGFSEVEVVDADSPLVCRDRHRAYCFQPLSKESAITPSDDVIRISTPASHTRPAPGPDVSPNGAFPVPDKTTHAKPPTKGSDPTPSGESPGPGNLAALIRESEALHEALSQARARAGGLTVALRRYRRRERLVSHTLASLKALKLQEVAG